MGSLHVCLGHSLPNFMKIGRKKNFDRGSDRGIPALGCELPREGLTLWGKGRWSGGVCYLGYYTRYKFKTLWLGVAACFALADDLKNIIKNYFRAISAQRGRVTLVLR